MGRTSLRSAITKDNTGKNDDLAAQLNSIQGQLCHLVLDSRMNCQDTEEREEMATRLATIEAKLENSSVSSITNPLFSHQPQDHRFYNTKTLFK